MFFKNILIFFLFLFSLNLVFANSCLFDFTSDDCKRVVNPYNTFNINIEGNYKLDKFESRLCNKENPSNCLKTENDFDNKKVIQVEPFINLGIYELSVKLYLKGGNFIEKSYEIIYDVSETKIPVIPMKIYTPSSSLNIEGNIGLGDIQIFAVGSAGTKNVLSDKNGNFSFSLSGLSSGINYYKFYSQNSLGIKSDIVERIIVSGAKIEENLQRVSSINLASLESLNERTIKSGSNYISSKRNFYVQGTANGPAGARIFVNGQRAIFDGNKFGAFVLLNEGDNHIKIINGDTVEISFNVFYGDFRFMFQEINLDKIFSTNSLTIDGKTNFDLPFKVFLNGEFKGEKKSNLGSFSFQMDGFKNGKNIILFEGFNNQKQIFYVYKDISAPEMNVLNFDKISKGDMFIFEIKDDIGINFDSLNVRIGSKNYKKDQMSINGDIFQINISDYADGTYTYEISVNDKSGKSASLASNFQINSNYAFIEDFVLENGFLIGNRIYSKSNSQTIILKPSRFIAFKKIYLDGDEIIDYEIKGNSNVIINLNFAKKNGILKFEYINNNYETFSQNFEYYTDLEKPILSLDYIYKDIMPMGNFYLISGNVNDSYFNKSSLTVNSKDNVFWYGDNFEAYLEVSSAGINNLRVFGKDMSGNFFDEQYGSILFGDNTFTNINSDSYPKKDFITLNFLSSDSSRNKNFIYSYDGFFQRGFYVKSASNNLVSHDREGLRSLKLKSYESSGKSKLSDLLYSLDSSEPKIYYINFNNGFADFIIDGTLSEIDLDSIWAKSDGNLKTVNFCTDSYFKYDTCLRVSTSFGSNVEIFVKDMAGNEILKNFAINDNFNNITYDLKTGAQVYFSGNDLYASSSETYVMGQFRAAGKVESVKIQGSRDCLWDDFNFVCPALLRYGENNLYVNVTYVGGSGGNNTTIILPGDDLGLKILDVFGDDLYNIANKYYLLSNDLNFKLNLSDNATLSLLINGNERLLSFYEEGEILINLNMDDYISSEEQIFDIQFKAENDKEERGFTQILKIYYMTILNTLVEIIIS